MKDIPVHQLRSRVSSGIDIKKFSPGQAPKDALGAHRDDHYMFFLMESGKASLMIDFHEIVFQDNALYYVLPGQVHHGVNTESVNGWYLAVDTPLISPEYRNIFENLLTLQQPYALNQGELTHCKQLLCLLLEKYKEDDQSPFYLPVVHSLLQSFLGIAAQCYSQAKCAQQQASRPAQLSHEFKKLLTQNIRNLKSPSAYAAKLNVSESYLNEALKKTTGLPVSYWITQEVVLEAKRLLYYSQLNVKEIAHTLGFDDHAYFSRLFKKSAMVTPLTFRVGHRK